MTRAFRYLFRRELGSERPVAVAVGVAAVRLVSAAVVLARIARGATREPSLAPIPGGRTDSPSGAVSVIIPARDEEARLGPCLAALGDDPAVTDVTVVDDESNDGTAAVAQAYGVPLISAGRRPHGWAGKTWALQRGLTTVTGDWVVTLDADTRVKPGLIDAAVAAAQRSGVDLLSVGARFDCPSSGERFLHASMLCTLVYRFGPPGSRRPPRPGRTVANGQCMVLPRKAFLAAGGFEPVADSLTEDVALARLMARRHGTVRFVDGADLLEVAGYGSAGAVWHGWGRSLALAEVTPLPMQVADLVLLWVTQAAPLPRILLGRGDPLDAVLLLARVGTLVAVAGAYRRRGLAWWLSPLADAAVVAGMTSASLRPVRTWRGRTYGPGNRAGRAGRRRRP